MQVVSSFLTFPGINWWVQVSKADLVMFDKAEYFQKMSYRNRYRISGANGSILLSVPLVSGREQKNAMRDVEIFNEQNWQIQHWRTLVSVYRRSPYFDHYEPSLKPLFENRFDLLTDFNMAGIGWARKQLGFTFEIKETVEYVKKYPPDIVDLRNSKNASAPLPKYYQVFEDRIGFIPNLSILDLLFSEGPGARDMVIS
jgi:hypothetical protein